MYPTFSVGETNEEKKREVAEFINRNTHIKIAELVEELLKNELLKAVSEEYYMELRQGVLQYDGVSTSELLEHIFTNYARIDNELLINNKREFKAPPDLSGLINVYFKKQEEFQRLAADGKIPIIEAETVMQVQTHLGATGIVNTKYLAWKNKAAAELKWAPAKKYLCVAISDVEELNKLTTGEAGLTANAAVADKSINKKVCEEMAEKLGESFDTLAMAATAKNDTIESLIKTIIELTSTNSELTATIKKLANQLERAQNKNGRSKNTNTSNGGKWPHWCAPDAYCFTCGYKLGKVHDSTTCRQGMGNPNHIKEAMRQKTMGGSKANAGFGNAPNGK